MVVDFHHPFLIELERFVLLGGKTLVALWRTVGERKTEENVTITDRHATSIDPMVRLRREIVDCFTNEQNAHNFQPLTHTHRKNTVTNLKSLEVPPVPPPGKLERRHTIELKTPGLGSGDGFIHTTLCRLPLECFSMTDIELEPIHRLCREASACYSGHRMLVHKFRFLETTGAGGDSNPCEKPLFDETMVAPLKVGAFRADKTDNAAGLTNLDRNALTTGRAPVHMRSAPESNDTNAVSSSGNSVNAGKRMESLFEPPSASN